MQLRYDTIRCDTRYDTKEYNNMIRCDTIRYNVPLNLHSRKAVSWTKSVLCLVLLLWKYGHKWLSTCVSRRAIVTLYHWASRSRHQSGDLSQLDQCEIVHSEMKVALIWGLGLSGASFCGWHYNIMDGVTGVVVSDAACHAGAHGVSPRSLV